MGSDSLEKRACPRRIATLATTILIAAALFAQAPKPPAQAATPEAASVLILVNDEVAAEKGTGRRGASVWVGESYAEKRGIPSSNIVHLRIPNTASPRAWDSWHISWDTFETYIRKPVLKALNARDAAHAIQYIIPVYGVPSHLASYPGVNGEGWSIDSFLASIESPDQRFRLQNPYRADIQERKAHFRDWQNPGGWKMHLVTRLDGPTPEVAVGLVDKAMRAEANLKAADGIGYFDFRHLACCDGYYQADRTMIRASEFSEARGFRTVFNDQGETKHMIQDAPNALWAWGWYSGPKTNDVYRFVDGAVGAQLTSYTADGIRGPRPGAWVELWLRRGITATWGATTEPTVDGYANGDTFFWHFWNGYNFAESAYLASPLLNHTMVFVGDPLYAPAIFRNKE